MHRGVDPNSRALATTIGHATSHAPPQGGTGLRPL
eukprot:CAMPEP_0204113992 /NCGR_PEP_ID=MMETSP0361-20130328/3985_1 /ASSEMBLY_ACC=CAM_ASM_000343 /TAXON_ID=268821 /ORGANISM="Scrippsiella Hangoei, Strain SHTV-5" /LENGTH=34 /DNA_ID= /DNA_START= /DNA_END= /DNA_ORIENTATION=